MRVIDPKQRKLQKKASKRSKKPIWLALLFLLILGGGIIYKTQKTTSPAQTSQTQPASITHNIQPTPKQGKLKIFTGEQFSRLYDNMAYPNTAPINEHTPITGNEAADSRIKEIAVNRGYKSRSAPVSNVFVDIGGGFSLQRKAAQPWLDLKEAAKKDNINLGLNDAYRSADDQKQIFLSRLTQAGVPAGGVSSGSYDAQISQVLRRTAIPGYSRHHTGYTVDISCLNQPATSFEYTVCFNWLSANNYEKTKTYGWIPGYPEGATNQGPDPESWEYVWVGTDAVTE